MYVVTNISQEFSASVIRVNESYIVDMGVRRFQ
jgi:hypothetical protein